MQFLKTFGLCQRHLRGRDDNHHIGGGMAVQVLIGNTVYKRWHGELARLQVGGCLGGIKRQHDIVKAQDTVARPLGQGDGILADNEVIQGKRERFLAGIGIAAYIIGTAGDGAYLIVIDGDDSIGSAVERHVDY